MKHPTESLLLAAALRPIAIELRLAALKSAKEQEDLGYKQTEPLPISYTAAARAREEEMERLKQERATKAQSFEAQWRAEHPITEFAAAALAELEAIASAITP